MSLGLFRVSVLGVALSLIAGCNGLSGGGSGTGNSGNLGGGSSSTTVEFTIAGATPTAVASQVGAGSFSAAMLDSGKVTLTLPDGTTTFAVAFACPPYNVPDTSPTESITYEFVYEASSVDGTAFSGDCPSSASGSSVGSALTGSVDASAISQATFVDVDVLSGSTISATEQEGLNADFTLAVPAGNDRVEVLAFNVGPVIAGGPISLVAAKNFASQMVPGALNGGNTVVLGAGDETTLEPITYSGVPAGFNAPTTAVIYDEAEGSGFGIAEAAMSEYPALPASAMESGDSDHFIASSSSLTSSGQVIAEMVQAPNAPVSVTFPPAWSYTGPAAAALPSFDLSYSGFSGKTGGCNEMRLSWGDTLTTFGNIQLVATANYLNGSTTAAVPDLSSVPGFLAPPLSGTNVEWRAEIYQSDYECLIPLPFAGTVEEVTNDGQYSEP